MKTLKRLFPHFLDSTLNSYTLVFFSNHKLFGIILILVSFFDVFAGISGMVAVLVANLAAYLIGLNTKNIRDGVYGFNSLLVGLGLGLFYQPNTEFFLVLAFASLLSLMISTSLEGVVGKYGLPFLSLPFLIGLWILMLASRHFDALYLSERGIFSLNEMYSLGGKTLVDVYEWINRLDLPASLVIYFRSLGAILFQYHLVPGLVLAIGLLLYSRIAFLLSLLGFYAAYYYYAIIGANFDELSYGYIGFNFILTSIAIGGFFLLSSWYSILWVILLTPLISFFITATSELLWVYQLSIFSLPFNMVVLLFLYFLKFRQRFYTKPELILHQQFSPEKNLYTQKTNKHRFAHDYYLPLSLPFFGEWTVSQGHAGKHTHRDGWQHAWDFEIQDEKGSFFSGLGSQKEDYYCYGKPVLAPADGWIAEAIGYVDDNEIGEMNLERNWGNTVIIKHTEALFTKLSHLKQGSLKVNKGDYVRKGDLLAACGNSGRSPRPHLHFQVQATPHIGSKTLDYPISNYMKSGPAGPSLASWERPAENDSISNIQLSSGLARAFQFVPGQHLHFEILGPAKFKGKIIDWEVKSDMYNYTYLYCEASQSKAYFKNDSNIHYFTHFEGNKKSLLFAFYTGAYQVMQGFYKGLEISDRYPVDLITSGPLLWLQDFLAPFYCFIRASYTLSYLQAGDEMDGSAIQLLALAEVKAGSFSLDRIEYRFEIKDARFSSFSVIQKNQVLETREILTEAEKS